MFVDAYNRFRSMVCLISIGFKSFARLPYAHLHTIIVITSHNNSSKPAEGKGSAVEVRHKAFKL